MNWKYVKNLQEIDLINEFEKEFNCKLPDDFIKCVKNNNAGRPELNSFDTEVTSERTIKKLLSFNKNDSENIWNANKILNKIQANIIAFAMDSFGNYICFDTKNTVVFFEHETETMEIISDNFNSFLSKLK